MACAGESRGTPVQFHPAVWIRVLSSPSPVFSSFPQEKNNSRPGQENRYRGYVLIHAVMDYTIYHKIKLTPKVIRVLSGSSYFSVIPDSEIQVIKKLTDNMGIVDLSTAYIQGSKVSIVSGPLKGNEGLIQKIDKRRKRAKIKLIFNGLEKLVDVGLDLLEPVK